ncbi:hypothetical protein [Enemella evansiae]|uniref:hypothetical protein n=1 Tax=Enemella evansiae TaxID=2016499 RepID=UPI000B978639|nr:hypothetical protein [Enemella evansiae]OYO19504.1 hypothetical protein BI335_04475 [Enemella evansiae]TDO91458.1 hypothetical protein C8D81_1762 [Enemella evansiae]
MSEQRIDKEQVRSDLLSHLRGGEDVLDEAVQVRATDAAPTDDGAYTIDDEVQADEAGDTHAAFQQVDDAQADLVADARGLDFSPKDTVEPGAIITLAGDRYVVGVASDEFTSGGATYAGIGTDAPLYAELRGKRAGDSVSFRGETSSIDAVC